MSTSLPQSIKAGIIGTGAVKLVSRYKVSMAFDCALCITTCKYPTYGGGQIMVEIATVTGWSHFVGHTIPMTIYTLNVSVTTVATVLVKLKV